MRKTSESLLPVYSVGLQQAISISTDFNSRSFWLIFTVTVLSLLQSVFSLTGTGVGEKGGIYIYILEHCWAGLWEDYAWSVS